MTYTAEQAHADGRHEVTHPEDRILFARVCYACATRWPLHGLPRV